MKINFLSNSIAFVGLILTSVLFNYTLSAQEEYKVDIDASELKVSGTSSVHDWSMQGERFSGYIYAVPNGNTLEKIERGTFSFKAEGLDSDNSIMNNKTHDALKSDDHPEITFKLTAIDNFKTSAGTFTGTASGELTVAGKARYVNVPFTGKYISNNKITIEGTYRLKMTDYDMDPPTAMLGTLKTGDEVSVDYSFTLLKK